MGDFLDYGSMRRAVDGVSTVYFAYPVQEGLLEATVNMAVAARNAGVTRLVDMVMLVSTPDAPTPRLRENYLSEQVFEWAGIGAAHVRAAVFFENIRSLANAASRRGCSWRPSGDEATVLPLVAGEDVARVAVGVLAAAEVPEGSSFRVIGEVLTVKESSPPWRAGSAATSRLPRRSRRGLGGDGAHPHQPHAVAHLSKLWANFRNRDRALVEFAVTDTIQELGGRKPKTFDEFVIEEKSTFAA